jgi:hypothetical protein
MHPIAQISSFGPILPRRISSGERRATGAKDEIVGSCPMSWAVIHVLSLSFRALELVAQRNLPLSKSIKVTLTSCASAELQSHATGSGSGCVCSRLELANCVAPLLLASSGDDGREPRFSSSLGRGFSSRYRITSSSLSTELINRLSGFMSARHRISTCG